MAWRVIGIEKPAKLSLRDNKLVITQDEEVAFPLEDIDSVVIDNREVVMTVNVIAALSQFDINALICDEKHMPSTIILPHGKAARSSKNARTQLGISEPLRKQLWRKNIMQKINNQADALDKHNHLESATRLRKLASTVRSGDVSNNEGVAARIYFDALLGDATRREPMWYNSALNYAYAIVRGSIARSAAARGLITELGINHHSELNQYNLIDDLIESFRPLVDDYVLSKVAPFHLGDEYDSNLTKNDRHLLLDVINQYGIIIDRRYAVKHLAEITVGSFLDSILDDSIEPFKLPKLI